MTYLHMLRELLHTKARQDDVYEKLGTALGESVDCCEIVLVEDFHHGFSSLQPAVADELFRLELSGSEVFSQTLSPEMKKLKKADINIDNSLRPSHTLLQVHCLDQKGLLYDIMRTLKDCNIKVSHVHLQMDHYMRCLIVS